MKRFALICAISCLTATHVAADSIEKPVSPAGSSKRSAKEVFARARGPANLQPAAIGSYSKGCLAGGVELPFDGDTWQVMRPSRKRNWGHPHLVRYIQKLARDARAKDSWTGLLVGDMSQPRGGPMLTGPRTNQSGLEADIWFTPKPAEQMSRSRRERMKATSVVLNRQRVHPASWTDSHAKLLRRAASYPEVGRIFVNPPIKKALCDWAAGDKKAKSWLRKIRPWYGNSSSFHVRLRCPAGNAECVGQEPPESGDGCGEDLEWWMSDAPYSKDRLTKSQKRRLRIGDLPRTCRAVASSK